MDAASFDVVVAADVVVWCHFADSATAAAAAGAGAADRVVHRIVSALDERTVGRSTYVPYVKRPLM
jgi:hypothetical protein